MTQLQQLNARDYWIPYLDALERGEDPASPSSLLDLRALSISDRRKLRAILARTVRQGHETDHTWDAETCMATLELRPPQLRNRI
jgi:hypothetical protein